MKKRVIAMALCFVMLMSVVPMSAMAQGTKKDIMLSSIDFANRQAEFLGISPEDAGKVNLDFDKIKLEVQSDMVAEDVEDVLVQQGCVKIRGVVTENAYTDIWSYKSIDTQDDETVVINIVDTYGSTHKDFKTNSYGEYVGNIDTFLVGDSDASNFIGKSVIAYVREIDNDWEIVSIEEDSARNITLTIGLEQIESFPGDELRYYETATSPTATKARLDNDATLIYNNVGGYWIDIIDDFIGSLAGGQITLIDNDDVNGYDVLFLDVAETAVVHFAEDGYVAFKNATVINDIFELEYDARDTDKMVKVIKNGEEIALSELKEWDVLSIYAESDDADYILAEVCANTVVGVITGESNSWTSATGRAYKINGVKYDVAEGAYGVEGITVGDGGEFYIDKYGKIAAFREDIELATGVKTNYAYVTAVAFDEDILTGRYTAIIQMVTAEGLVALNVKSTGAKFNGETFDADDYDVDEIAEALEGKMIKYSKNTSNEITAITTFGWDDRFDGGMYDPPVMAEYDSDNNRFINKFWMDKDSQVFFVDPYDIEDSYLGSEKDLVDGEIYEIMGKYADNKADDNNIVIILADVERPEVPEVETDKGYAYVTAVAFDEDLLTGKLTAIVQMITSDGVDVLELKGKGATIDGDRVNADDDRMKIEELWNKVIRYSVNESGKISSIVTADNNGALTGGVFRRSLEYNAENLSFDGNDGFEITEDAQIFIVNPYDNDESFIGTASNLTDGETYDILARYSDGDSGEYNIVVILADIEKPEVPEVETDMGYAYVTAVAADEDFLTGKAIVYVQLVTENGLEVFSVKSSKMKFDDMYIKPQNNLQIFEDICNQIIRFSVNEKNEISTIATAEYNLEGRTELINATYDKYANQFINKFYMDANSYVFFIDSENVENSYLGSEKDLIDGVGYEIFGAYADEEATNNNIIIVKNRQGLVSPKAGFAVIKSVGVNENTDGEQILSIEALLDGETIIADTTSDMFYETERSLTEGDIVKLNINQKGIIDGLAIVFDFEEGVRYITYGGWHEVMFDKLYESYGLEVIAGGVVENYKKTSTVATIDGQDFKLSQADNVYVIDANGRMLNITKGSASDFKYHEALYTEDVQRVNVTIGYEEFDDVDVEEARMAADYVFVREYDGRVSDVVIVKGPEDMKVRESYYYSINAPSLDENAAALSSSDEVVVKVTNLTLTGEKAENYNLTTKAVYAVVSREILANLGVSGQNVTVSGTEAGTYAKGATITLTATPNPGYAFKGWYTDGRCVGTDKTYEFVLGADIELTAKAELKIGVSACGKDSNGIVWCLYERGILEIEGQGAMDNYSSTTMIPWYSSRNKISEISIGDGITHIGDKSFYNLISAKKVSIPESVESIGAYAFHNCDELTVYGALGSYAETYATNNNIPFAELVATTKLAEIAVELTENQSKWYFDISLDEISRVANVYVSLYAEDDRMLSVVSDVLVMDDVTTLSIAKRSDAAYAKIHVVDENLFFAAISKKIEL